MNFPKKTVIALLVLVGIQQGCKIRSVHNETKSAQYTADFSPEGIVLESAIVRHPNCDWFACNGGSIYILSETTSEQIKADRIEFFKNLQSPQIGKNGRSLGPWQHEFHPDDTKNTPYLWWNGDGRDHPVSKRFKSGMKKYGYYISDFSREPLIIIVPEEQLIYIGYFD